MEKQTIRPIAHVVSDYNEKFGVPRQPGLVDLEQAVVIDPEFSCADAVRGLEDFTHIWLIWGFSGNVIDMEEEPVKWHPTVRPPLLGGKIRKGVWATRSPYRPNSLGLSSVRLLRVEQSNDRIALIISGADMMNGTPVYDIKPYIPYSDAHPDAGGGFTDKVSIVPLRVIFPDELLGRIDEGKQNGLIRILESDPRGAYEKQPGKVYGLSFADWDIRFTVDEDVLTVTDVLTMKEAAGVNVK